MGAKTSNYLACSSATSASAVFCNARYAGPWSIQYLVNPAFKHVRAACARAIASSLGQSRKHHDRRAPPLAAGAVPPAGSATCRRARQCDLAWATRDAVTGRGRRRGRPRRVTVLQTMRGVLVVSQPCYMSMLGSSHVTAIVHRFPNQCPRLDSSNVSLIGMSRSKTIRDGLRHRGNLECPWCLDRCQAKQIPAR